MPVSLRRAGLGLGWCLALLAVGAPSATAGELGKAVSVKPAANGAKRLTYRVGPFDVRPGQNEIAYNLISQKPQVDGYITRIRPDLTYLNGRVPGVDVIHLHHGVWVNASRKDATDPALAERFFASGEEKTRMQLPKGYGYPYKASDTWILNHMIHNLTPVPTQVYMVYEIDFIPKSSPAARGIRPVRPIWMDVHNGSVYPVFNAEKGAGPSGRFTFPDDAANPYGGGSKRNEWVVDRPGVLVATAGHLHPGGLYTDLYLRRPGAQIHPARCGTKASASARRRCRREAPRGSGDTAHLFRSRAKYYEPAGAVSWDVSMTATKPNWRVELRKGDVLGVKATYDTSRASWWESMGINPLTYMAYGGRGVDPFKHRVDYKGVVTHGHLPENGNHGGGPTGLPDPRTLPDGADNPSTLDILDFKYQFGDGSLGDAPPVIHAGQALTFRNGDDGRSIYHSITSCKPPCNRSTGIAYPIADGDVQFESSTLGSTSLPATGATEWKTPDNLSPGTYTYFCRIHPFMRGSFRVKP